MVAGVGRGGQGDFRTGSSLRGRGRSRTAAVIGHGDGVLVRRGRGVLLEDGLDLHVALRHGELVALDGHITVDHLPLLEVVACVGCDGQGDLRTGGSLCGRCRGRTAAAIGDGDIVEGVFPQRLDSDVVGDGHGGVHRILRITDLPRLELLSLGCDELALGQIIRTVVQDLLGGHCGGDSIGQILRLGAAVRVKSDGMIDALFKRRGDGDVLPRLPESIGIILNRKADGGAVDGQRAEHIALVGNDGEHHEIVLVEQGRAVRGGFRGIRGRDRAVFAACNRYPVLRRSSHFHVYPSVLIIRLLRIHNNIRARQIQCSGNLKALLLLGRRIILLRYLPNDRDSNFLHITDGCTNRDRLRKFIGQHRSVREIQIAGICSPVQRIQANPVSQIENRISAGISDINIVVDIVVHVCRDRINAVFIRFQNRLTVLHRNRRIIMHLELQIAPIGRAFRPGCARIGFAFQLPAGGIHYGQRVFTIQDEPRGGDVFCFLFIGGLGVDVPLAVVVLKGGAYESKPRFRIISIPCNAAFVIQFFQLL